VRYSLSCLHCLCNILHRLFRFVLNRENVVHSLTMIQPTLDAYSFEGPPYPVMLSATSVLPDRILLLDTFFHVVIFRGDNIARWVKLGYQNDPKYENFRLLLAAPRTDAEVRSYFTPFES